MLRSQLEGLCVRVTPRGFRMRASDAKAVMKASGRTLTELIDDSADLGDKLQAFAFLELRKLDRANGEESDPGELWSLAEDVDVDLIMDGEVPTPDPLSATSSSS